VNLLKKCTFAAVHESGPGPLRRFAAVRQDVGNRSKPDARMPRPPQPHLTSVSPSWSACVGKTVWARFVRSEHVGIARSQRFIKAKGAFRAEYLAWRGTNGGAGG
jgi:hypothetical protein